MKRILIIDDEKRIQRIYVDLFTMEGFEVIVASDAIEATEILKANNINLALLDIKMPKIGGDTVYEIMQLFHRQVKVIVSSVYPTDEQKQIIPQADDYYDKAEGVGILLEKVIKVLKN